MTASTSSTPIVSAEQRADARAASRVRSPGAAARPRSPARALTAARNRARMVPISSIATSSLSGPAVQRFDGVDQPSKQRGGALAPAGSAAMRSAAIRRCSPASPRRSGPSPIRPSMIPSVYSSIAQSRGSSTSRCATARRRARSQAPVRPSASGRDRGPVDQEPAAGDRRGRVDARCPRRVDLERAQRREQARQVALVLEHPCRGCPAPPPGLAPASRQRAPCGSQHDADRRFVGAVAADVADQRRARLPRDLRTRSKKSPPSSARLRPAR